MTEPYKINCQISLDSRGSLSKMTRFISTYQEIVCVWMFVWHIARHLILLVTLISGIFTLLYLYIPGITILSKCWKYLHVMSRKEGQVSLRAYDLYVQPDVVWQSPCRKSWLLQESDTCYWRCFGKKFRWAISFLNIYLKDIWAPTNSTNKS